MSQLEILAPAGGMEQLYAAVRCGADAIYLGTKGFNARQNAQNFDDNTLSQAISYCHGRNVKVFVTVNTLVMDGQMEQLEQEAQRIAAAGVDAVIIQDMAVAQLFAQRYPTIPRYASTQTAVHNVDGAKFLQDMGFSRIVLARELTLKEIERICRAIDISAEAFIHGAHCMSVSGACYLSAMLGGRSGNRGLCAQPCRLNWQCGQKEYALSLKDMSLIPHMEALAKAGVDSFKIEGRMKRPEYVAAAVSACYAAREGKSYDIDTLQAVFSRSGFTDGYLMGKRDASMFGSRTREDVTSAQNVLGKLADLYRNEMPRVAIDMKFQADTQSSSLWVSDRIHQIQVKGALPEQAMHRAMDRDSAYKSLSKTGGTPFSLRDFQAQIAPGIMLPASALNAMRRQALEELLQKRSALIPHPEAEGWESPAFEPHVCQHPPALWARFAEPEQIVCTQQLEKIFLPAKKITPELIAIYGGKLAAELPAVLFPQEEEDFCNALKRLKEAGLKEILTDNIYGIQLAKKLGLKAHGGFGLNGMNTPAINFFEKQGLASLIISFELSMAKIKALGGQLPRGVISYGHLPLMRLRNCPIRANLGCGKCRGKEVLTDRKGITFPVECSDRKYVTLLNSLPLHIAERNLKGLDFQMLYFTLESTQNCEKVVEEFLTEQSSPQPRTGGLYYRELL